MLKRFLVGVTSAIALGNVFASQADAVMKGNLTVGIEGLRSQRGQVCLTLFDSSQGFPAKSDRALQAQCVRLDGKPLAVTFRNLKTGSYAVAVIHDTNNDGNLNRNAIGIPTEGFGFSRNPRIMTGPPKFSDAAVVVVGAKTDIQIRLQYLLGG